MDGNSLRAPEDTRFGEKKTNWLRAESQSMLRQTLETCKVSKDNKPGLFSVAACQGNWWTSLAFAFQQHFPFLLITVPGANQNAPFPSPSAIGSEIGT